MSTGSGMDHPTPASAPYYEEVAAAFVRAHLGGGDLSGDRRSDAEWIELGHRQGLRLHRFKRRELPRVDRVLGILKGLSPTDLLDIGSGRGTFLWPLTDALPYLPVTAVDVLAHRLRDIAAVRRGGIGRLRPVRQSVLRMGFCDGAFHSATVLEVLEHLETPALAARELVRVTRHYVVASVPSKPDDNPEHLRLFQPDELASLFLDAGARDVQVGHVLNHRIAVVKV